MSIFVNMKEQKLLLVYNADSGFTNGLIDLAHKTFSPDTYNCALCGVSYGFFGMRNQWKAYLGSLDMPLEFLHRDEFSHRYPLAMYKLPLIGLVNKNKDLKVLLDPSDFEKIHTLKDLESTISRKLG